jgi:hypothetical protein
MPIRQVRKGNDSEEFLRWFSAQAQGRMQGNRTRSERWDAMASTLEVLEKRLAALEEEVKVLRMVVLPSVDDTLAEQGARAILMARLQHPALVAGWDRAMEQMGIKGEPIPAEQLQQMMRADGIKPEDNEVSREIIRMRGD